MEAFKRRVMIRDIISFFNFEQLTGNDDSLNRWVVVPDINRPGLELSGYEKLTEPRRIVIIGSKEMEYIQEMTPQQQYERFQLITDSLTPMILITHNFECPPILKEMALANNFPIFRTDSPTYRVMVDIITYLDEKLAESDSVHGVLMTVYGVGTLIIGESGMGKSEIALELIKKGHVLVADDRVDVSRVHNTIVGKSAPLLEGMLEIRGIGIIDVAKMFGASALLKNFNINLVIKLVKYDQNENYARIGNETPVFWRILGVDLPMMVIPVKEGRSMGVIIESAVTNFRLKQSGVDSAKEFEDKVYQFISMQKEENE